MLTPSPGPKSNKSPTIMDVARTAGILICPALGTPKTLLKEVKSWGIPMVVMIRHLGPGAYDYVGSDNEQGMFMATQHLIDRGHRHIGGQSGAVFEQRSRGYRHALEAARLKLDPQWILPASPNRSGGREAMTHLLDLRRRPTAAVCYNDITAFGALTALGEHGLRAGVDFALMGFDNVLDAEHSNPPLSTIDIEPKLLGEHAAQALLARIGNPALKHQMVVIQPQLKLRQSA